MKKQSRIRFNPTTKEIEVEGSESFVKAYFDKLQAMLNETPKKPAMTNKISKATKLAGDRNAKASLAKAARSLKDRKASRKEPGKKRITNIEKVISLIQASREGITTAQLKGKTGLPESQIWNIVNRATKAGKIKKMKKGVYVGIAAGIEQKSE